MLSDADKERCVDAWLEDVTRASDRWRFAKASQAEVERMIAFLEEIAARVAPVPSDLGPRIESAVAQARGNARMLADAAAAKLDLERGFYAAMQHVDPPEVAEAWRLRVTDRLKWWQCANAVGYSRAHLERLSKQAKVQVYQHIPEAYRRGE